MSDTNPSLPAVQAADASKATLPLTLVASLLIGAAALGGSAYVTADKVKTLEATSADHERRLQRHDTDSAVMGEKVDRMVRSLDRLEDRLGTKPAHE